MARRALEDVKPLVLREGDNVHVRFPEITLPLSVKFATAKIGGSSITRQMKEGDEFHEQTRSMAQALFDFTFEQARGVLRRVNDEILSKGRKD